MADKIHILLSITNSYVAYCAVTISSILENNRNNKVCIHIICEDLAQENKTKLKYMVEKYEQELNFIQPNIKQVQQIKNVLCRMPAKHNISTFYRLFAAEWLPQNIEKVIYLDCDLIVIEDLASLWKEKISEDIPLCAIYDFVRINDYHRLGINFREHIYFNAGVLLINLSYWRKHSIAQQCIDYILSFPERLLLADQDILNALTVGKIKYLHPRYNTMTYMFCSEDFLAWCSWYNEIPIIKEATENPIIIHFAGTKPWHKGEYLPYREKWIKYLNMTEWKNIKIKYKKGWIGWIRLQFKQPILKFLSGRWGIFITDPSFYLKK